MIESRPRGGAAAVPSVAVGNARLRFGDTLLFEALDFELAAGSWTCLLGSSGVGKSSLLRLVAGLARHEPPTRVSASDGQPLAGRIAYMAQQDLLLPWLTALDNVLLGTRLRGQPVTINKVAEARRLLDDVGLGGRDGLRPAALSGGMRQRVALARTLMEDRPVVLMDEPFSAVDALTRIRLQDLAARLLAGRTVLLVTHDPLEALRLGSRVHVMSGFPATIGPALIPPGPPPRPVGDPAVLELQAALLQSFTA
ncbi:MAG: ATP-binding cassette domain-containing protein [Azospirillum sp.]|nr:ATP-binding cassette domain-containing protein [Azospirillum sp.]